MIEKHYDDARVDAHHLDEMIGSSRAGDRGRTGDVQLGKLFQESSKERGRE